MTAESIEAIYSEAYALVEQGICYDEVGNRDGALAMYERGLELIDRAGQIPGANGSVLFAKMAAAREHILYRLKDLRSGTEDSSSRPDSLPQTAAPFQAIENTIQAFGDSKSAEEIFHIPGGAQIFYIDGDESSVPSYPGPLRIFRFRPESPFGGRGNRSEEAGERGGDPPAFVQVADWVYPLIPGRSPVLQSEFGAYMFPNPTNQNPDMCVGLLLPDDVGQEARGEFQRLMREYTEMRQQSTESNLSTEEKQRLSSKISKLLVSGGQAIAWGVKKGQEMASNYASKEAERQLVKHDKATQPMSVDPRVETSVHYIRKGTKVAVRVSGYLVKKVGDIATKVGSHVADRAQKKVGDKSSAGGRLVGDTIEVVKGGVAGVATVWMGLEDAARVLARDIANESVRVVDHRYGEAAARVTMDAMKAAGHGGMAAWNVYELGPKSIAKRSAKQAGLSFLSDMGGGGAASGSSSNASVNDQGPPPRPPPPSNN